jgi:hypothetical protein
MASTHLAFALRLAAIVGLMVVTGAHAAPAAAADQTTIQQLQKQVDDLDAEFTKLKSAAGADLQNQIVQRHWGMMLDHLRSTRIMPGLGDTGCTDWMMMDANVTGPGMMGSGRSMGCGILGHGTTASGVTGNGIKDWKLPASMTPDSYQRRLQDPVHAIHQQMAAIVTEKNPTKQQALVREHYDTMYRHIQMTRGMGWMWTPDEAAPVFADGSPQSQLVVKYCAQCHATPPPSIHTQDEWLQVTSRMRGHIYDRAAAWGGGVKVPDTLELEKIEDYLVATTARAH